MSTRTYLRPPLDFRRWEKEARERLSAAERRRIARDVRQENRRRRRSTVPLATLESLERQP